MTQMPADDTDRVGQIVLICVICGYRGSWVSTVLKRPVDPAPCRPPKQDLTIIVVHVIVHVIERADNVDDHVDDDVPAAAPGGVTKQAEESRCPRLRYLRSPDPASPSPRLHYPAAPSPRHPVIPLSAPQTHVSRRPSRRPTE